MNTDADPRTDRTARARARAERYAGMIRGGLTLRQVAGLAGVSPQRVAQLVRRFVGPVHALRPRLPSRKRRHWEAWELALLGAVSDAEVGRRLGLSNSAVARKRAALGIPPYRKPVKDRSGSRNGRLEVLRLLRVADSGETVWLCRCDCGAEFEVTGGNTRHQVSCGCAKRDYDADRKNYRRLSP